MKYLIYLGLFGVLASCSSSKYAAHFQKSNTEYGYGELAEHGQRKITPAQQADNMLVASTSKEAAIITTPLVQAAAVDQIRQNYAKLSGSEKKEFRKELKKEIKRMAFLPGCCRFNLSLLASSAGPVSAS